MQSRCRLLNVLRLFLNLPGSTYALSEHDLPLKTAEYYESLFHTEASIPEVMHVLATQITTRAFRTSFVNVSSRSSQIAPEPHRRLDDAPV